MKEIKQRDKKDCGVACIQYLMIYYGGYVPLEDLRRDTLTSVQGTNAYYLIETLKKYHFDVKGLKITADNLKEIILPCIVHVILPNGFHHFMVLEKIQEKTITVMDPAKGRRKLSKKEFLSIWDFVVIEAYPYKKITKLPKEKKIFNVLFHYLFHEKKYFVEILIIEFITILLTLISSFYLKIGYQELNFLEWSQFLIYLIIPFGVLTLLKNSLELLKELLKITMSKNIEVKFMYAFLYHLFHIPLRNVSSYEDGEILSRIEETEEIKTLFIDIGITLCFDFLLGLTSLIILYQISYKLTLWLFTGLVIYVLVGFLSSKTTYHVVLENIENEAIWKEKVLETIHFIPTMKHLNQVSYFLKQIELSLCERVSILVKHQKKLLGISRFKNTYTDILLFILCTYGLYLIKIKELSLINFITYESLYIYFLNPIKDLMDLVPKFNYMKGILVKISDYTNIKEEKEEKNYSNIDNSISAQNLSVSFYDQPIIMNKTFQINASEHVLLKGKSGCGKSTICQILLKEIDSYTGTILIGKHNLKDYSVQDLRSNLVYLSQQEPLLNTSLKENILLGRTVPESKLNEVLQICHIEEIVSKKALRFDSHITDNSVSGGEKERIILARTLLSDARIYILDECLGEVESSLEEDIIHHIQDYLKTKTLVYISHRNWCNLFERSISLD